MHPHWHDPHCQGHRPPPTYDSCDPHHSSYDHCDPHHSPYDHFDPHRPVEYPPSCQSGFHPATTYVPTGGAFDPNYPPPPYYPSGPPPASTGYYPIPVGGVPPSGYGYPHGGGYVPGAGFPPSPGMPSHNAAASATIPPPVPYSHPTGMVDTPVYAGSPVPPPASQAFTTSAPSFSSPSLARPDPTFLSFTTSTPARSELYAATPEAYNLPTHSASAPAITGHSPSPAPASSPATLPSAAGGKRFPTWWGDAGSEEGSSSPASGIGKSGGKEDVRSEHEDTILDAYASNLIPKEAAPLDETVTQILTVDFLPPYFQAALRRFTSKEVKGVKQQFESIFEQLHLLKGKGCSGRITLSEFGVLSGLFHDGDADNPLLRFMFNLLDVDGNGCITETDLICAMALLTRGTREEQRKRAFELLDVDKSESIDKMEFTTLVANTVLGLNALGVAVEMTNILPFCDEVFRLDSGSTSMTEEAFQERCNDQPYLIPSLGLFNPLYPPPLPRKGVPIAIGSRSWSNSLQMMIGIRSASRKAEKLDTGKAALISDDFSAKAPQVEFSLPSPSSGKAKLFVDYAPVVFRRIRSMYGVDEDGYLMSLGIEQVLGNLLVGNLSTFSIQGSEGKSGSFFYYSHDGRYLLKTIPSVEATAFLKILPQYYEHMRKNTMTSLITRFYGLHSIDGNTFVVMENVFLTQKPLHEIFDLKGSKVDRTNPHGGVKKDLDLKTAIPVGPAMKRRLMSALEKDSLFLESHGIMDYSLLIGVHYANWPSSDCIRVHPSTLPPAVSYDEVGRELAFYQKEDGGIRGRDGAGHPLSEVYYVGIIDTLTTYTLKKGGENFLKSLYNYRQKHLISAVPPGQYGPRFRAFMANVFE